jgi:hypothetical protein
MYSFASIPGFAIVNPLLYQLLPLPLPREPEDQTWMHARNEGAFLTTPGIAVISGFDLSTPGDTGLAQFFDQASALLRRLRHAFRQADLSDEVNGISQIEVESLPPLDTSVFEKKVTGSRASIFSTLLSVGRFCRPSTTTF